MPELPEVETVRRQLARVWEGRKILEVVCARPSYFFVTSPSALKKHLLGRTLRTLERRGKTLLSHFDDESQLLMHLGMTGQFVTGSLPPDPHVHMRLTLSGGKTLTFRDVRKFGKLEWIPPGKMSARLSKIGPDALSISDDELHQALSTRRIMVKTALLNQSVLAGVGNIYADEALFRARIKPTRMARRLSRIETSRLAASIRNILGDAVENGGSTINDYMRPDGELGGYQDFHVVYGKTGQPCSACQEPIARKVIGGRSSHYCKHCQV